MTDISNGLDWTAIIMGVNSALLAIVLILGGYIWRRAIQDLDEFRDQNREEHAAFMQRLGGHDVTLAIQGEQIHALQNAKK